MINTAGHTFTCVWNCQAIQACLTEVLSWTNIALSHKTWNTKSINWRVWGNTNWADISLFQTTITLWNITLNANIVCVCISNLAWRTLISVLALYAVVDLARYACRASSIWSESCYAWSTDTGNLAIVTTINITVSAGTELWIKVGQITCCTCWTCSISLAISAEGISIVRALRRDSHSQEEQ